MPNLPRSTRRVGMPHRFSFLPLFAISNVAAILQDGSWTVRELLRRLAQLTNRSTRGEEGLRLKEFVRDLRRVFPRKPKPDQRDSLLAYLAGDEPLPSFPPVLPTPGALADWLALAPWELDWFADVCGRVSLRSPPRVQHYTYRWHPRRGGRPRLIEVPKHHLKEIQRRLTKEILMRLPVHDAAHAYRTGRSILTNATPHVGQRLVLRLDLRDFFPSLRASRVHALFRTAGYSAPVARLLTGLCTNVVPGDVLARAPGRETRYSDRFTEEPLRVPHLPQGAPTSPALANLCAYRLDCRLAGLARAAGAGYTRYADDLVFSGNESFAISSRRFYLAVCAIALEEGFAVNYRKTRFQGISARQRVTGVVVNVHPNIDRRTFDVLKATLHNCVRFGPTPQNRESHEDFRAHLLGRIAHVAQLHPERGRRLREMFDRIDWSK